MLSSASQPGPLSAERQKLLALLLRERGLGGRARPAPPTRAPDPGPAPLSCAQQSLWLLDQVQGASPVYSESVAVGLAGSLDPAALEGSLARVV